jgi:protein-S-isoprenylcysteine O-methyltransferase Ste14
MWIIVGAITWPWRQVVLYTSAIPWMPGGLLIVTSMYLYRAAKTGFTGAQLGGRPELETAHWEQRLATEGIRARIRHPVYLAHLCEMMGWSIGSGLAACYALTLFAIVSGAFLLQAEDRELEGRFGEPYREYRRRVPAIFPRL